MDQSPGTDLSDADPFNRSWLQRLTPAATIGELPSFSVTVSPDQPTRLIDQQFGTRPELPGVIIATGMLLQGVISRPRLLAHLSRPFGQELYLNRPIGLLLELERVPPLVIPASTSISEAAHAALSRSVDQLYEPIVIQDPAGFRLLNVHALLLAQSRLLVLANETIQSQAQVAEAANQAKSLFLANMSHEIRTPLTAILGFAENLLDSRCTPDEKELATETILRNGHHLLQLINDILDLSKIEADRMVVERLRFSPGELVADVVSALRVRADAKRIGLNLVYDGPIPDTIESDPTRLRQVLMNLISNGIKFTEQGQVDVRLKMIDASGERCTQIRPDQSLRLQCDVVDSGIGMTSEQLDRLFSPFTQADDSMARRFGGTGLGLSISGRLTRMLGGAISVTSQPGIGSTFTVQIDAGPPTDVTWHERPSSIGKPALPRIGWSNIRVAGRILLAEDGPDNQLLIGSFLRKHGADVTVVENGRQAVEAVWTAHTNNKPYGIVLMDMQMPILDGYAATRELRRLGWKGPIIALTANVMQGDRQKCLEAGCTDFAAKPINRSDLIEQIDRLMIGRNDPDTSRDVTFDLAETPVIEGEALIDRTTALERVGGDEDLLRQIATVFLDICPKWLTDLQRHLEEQNASAAQRVAHSLKSSADNLGGQIAAATLSRLESAAADGRLDDAKSMWPECRAQMLRLMEGVEVYLKSTEHNS